MLYFFLFFSFLFGAVIGSFTNCFVWRLHEKESLWGRSYCPKCRKQIAWYDNIPVLSFLALFGRCRQCGKKISWQYPLVEFSTACLFALSFYFVSREAVPGGFDYYSLFLLSDSRFILTLVKEWLVIFVTTVIFIYDLRWYLIPDSVVLPACLLVFFTNLFLGFNWLMLLFCALIGGGFFLLQFIVSRGRWIGGGDIRLGLLLGLVTGSYELLILAILLTYCIGSIIGLGLVAIGRKHWGSKVPLGVFLAPALVVTIFFGKAIVNWYSGLYW
jgi:prepilin signal peptidase PulO-like enzyme (type II secretory pathway)